MKYNLKRVCNTIALFLVQFLMFQDVSLLLIYSVIVYVDKNSVYSIVFINIITNKSHLQSEDIFEFKSRRLIFADVIKM